MIPVANFQWCRWNRCQFVTGVVDTSTTPAELVAKFAPAVVDTGGKFATGVVDTGSAPWSANKFLKKFDMTLVLFSGAWEMMIHEKILSKDLVTLSL